MYILKDETVKNIADAIRIKTGKTETLKPSEMDEEILGITGEGHTSPCIIDENGQVYTKGALDKDGNYKQNAVLIDGEFRNNAMSDYNGNLYYLGDDTGFTSGYITNIDTGVNKSVIVDADGGCYEYGILGHDGTTNAIGAVSHESQVIDKNTIFIGNDLDYQVALGRFLDSGILDKNGRYHKLENLIVDEDGNTYQTGILINGNYSDSGVLLNGEAKELTNVVFNSEGQLKETGAIAIDYDINAYGEKTYKNTGLICNGYYSRGIICDYNETTGEGVYCDSGVVNQIGEYAYYGALFDTGVVCPLTREGDDAQKLNFFNNLIDTIFFGDKEAFNTFIQEKVLNQ